MRENTQHNNIKYKIQYKAIIRNRGLLGFVAVAVVDVGVVVVAVAVAADAAGFFLAAFAVVVVASHTFNKHGEP